MYLLSPHQEKERVRRRPTRQAINRCLSILKVNSNRARCETDLCLRASRQSGSHESQSGHSQPDLTEHRHDMSPVCMQADRLNTGKGVPGWLGFKNVFCQSFSYL